MSKVARVGASAVQLRPPFCVTFCCVASVNIPAHSRPSPSSPCREDIRAGHNVLVTGPAGTGKPRADPCRADADASATPLMSSLPSCASRRQKCAHVPCHLPVRQHGRGVCADRAHWPGKPSAPPSLADRRAPAARTALCPSSRAPPFVPCTHAGAHDAPAQVASCLLPAEVPAAPPALQAAELVGGATLHSCFGACAPRCQPWAALHGQPAPWQGSTHGMQPRACCGCCSANGGSRAPLACCSVLWPAGWKVQQTVRDFDVPSQRLRWLGRLRVLIIDEVSMLR